MKKLLDFLNRLDNANIFYRLSKQRPEYIMVEVAVPGQRWEIEFSDDDICVEKFIADGDIYGETELEILLKDFSD